MRTTELVDDVVQQDDFNDDGGAFGGGGDDWVSQNVALLDSESNSMRMKNELIKIMMI
jgi:hypothetical protein